MLFIDSDGVFADWEGYVLSRHIPHCKNAKELNKIERTKRQALIRGAYEIEPRLFANLPVLPNARELMERLTKEFGDDFTILTAVGDDHPDYDVVAEDKKEFFKREFGLDEDRIIVVRSSADKQHMAGEGKILVDDYDVNCQQWADKGGVGMIYKDGCSIDGLIDYIHKSRSRQEEYNYSYIEIGVM